MQAQFGQLETIVAAAICLFVLAAILIFVIALVLRKRDKPTEEAAKQPPATEAEDETWPYVLAPHFLSPAEYSFYRVLRTALNDALVICPKVNLGDIFHVQQGTASFMKWRAKINQKHVDFLLCQPDTMTPVFGIELDDGSHKREDRKKRDSDVNRIFATASLPLLHVPVQESYNVNEVRSAISELFSRKQTGA
jgi:hypothetical protein